MLLAFCAGPCGICSDKKTGMQSLEREYPTRPMEPGKPEKREHEYIRHGTRALIASFVVPMGQVVWNVGQTRTNADFAAIWPCVKQLPDMHRYDWVVDNLDTHWSLELPCGGSVVQGALCGQGPEPWGAAPGIPERSSHKHVLHFTPKDGSWLTRWSCGLASGRRFLERSESVEPKILQPVSMTI